MPASSDILCLAQSHMEAGTQEGFVLVESQKSHMSVVKGLRHRGKVLGLLL